MLRLPPLCTRSTTHTITGAVVGVGLMEGRNGVNWKHFAKTFASWVATLVLVGLVSAALFAQGAFAPSIQANQRVASYQQSVAALTNHMLNEANVSLHQYEAAVADVSGRQTWEQYNTTLSTLQTSLSNALDITKATVVAPSSLMQYLYKSLSFYQQQSALLLGQNIGPVCRAPDTATGVPGQQNSVCPAPSLVPSSNYMPWR